MQLNKKINVAVIGAGNMGKYHIRNYFEIFNVNLVAISDLREETKILAKKFKCKYYKDYQEMLDKENLEAVSVVVPTQFHKKIALDVINQGIHTFIEKPLASTVGEGEEIIRVAKKKGVKLTVGHIERFNPAIRKIKDIIKHGKLGNIISIIAKRVGPFSPQIKNANVLIELAVHDIDIINYLLEKEPTKIYANGGRAINGDKEDYAEIFLNYGPISGYIQVNWITPFKIRELHVTGTKAYAQLNYLTQTLDLYSSRYKKEANKYGNFTIKFLTPKKVKIPVKFDEPLKLELQSFLKSIKQNTQPEVTSEEGLKALEIALKALKNIKHA